MLFERPLPVSFTDIAGELELIFNYKEFDEDGNVTVHMPTNIFRTTVDEGGAPDEDVELGNESELLANQVNANTIAIDLLWSELESINDRLDELSVDEIFAELEALRQIKEEMQAQLDQLAEYKQQLFAAMADLEMRLLTRIEALESSATALEGRVTAAESDISDTKTDLTNTQADLAAHEAENKVDFAAVWADQYRQDGNITDNAVRITRQNDVIEAVVHRVAALDAPQTYQDLADRYATYQEIADTYASYAEILLGRDHIAEIWEQITSLWVAENALENKVNANILVAKSYHKSFTNATFSGEVWIKEFTHNTDVASVSIWGYATETAIGTTGQAFAILDPTAYPLLQRFIDQVDQWARGYNSNTGQFSDMPVRITAASGIEIVTPPNIPIGTRFTWQFVLYLSDETTIIEL